MNFFFLRGRSALSFGLKLLDLDIKSELLIPSFICDTVVKELIKNGYKPKYYKINKEFKPIWTDINKKISRNTKGIFMVNYFGKPQDKLLFRNFCDRNKIYLIEDNCHGFDGFYKFNHISDILITSPYKIIDKIQNGGILVIKKNLIKKKEIISKLKKYKSNYLIELIRKLKRSNYLKFFYRFFIKRPNYESVSIKNNENIIDYFLDDKTLKMINSFSFNTERKLRVNRFMEWKDKLKKFNLYPYFSYTTKDKYILWYLVVKVKNSKIRKKIFDWGWKNNVDIISWPSFPDEITTKNDIFRFSRSFILFPLNKDYYDQIRKFEY